MSFYWVKTNYLIKIFFLKYIWDIPKSKGKIFLTFDDGPIPELTYWVLEELRKNNAKGTFFCIGENINKHPEIFEKIILEGHEIGNHTYNHLNGWKTDTEAYLKNISFCEEKINSFKTILSHNNKHFFQNKLFRPPYGKIKIDQSRQLRKLGYKIIMWDILSGDFDTKINSQKCLENVINNAKSGSIIVFHDSVKAEKNLKYCLPLLLKNLTKKGYTFDSLRDEYFL